MPIMALSVAEREQFLAEPRVAALAVAAGPDRGPLVVPIWYQYASGGEVWLLMSPTSRKYRLMESAGRFSLMVERTEPTVRYVSVEGPVVRTAPRSEELLVEMTERYLPGEMPNIPANVFQEEGSVLGYDAIPPSEAPPDYPSPGPAGN